MLAIRSDWWPHSGLSWRSPETTRVPAQPQQGTCPNAKYQARLSWRTAETVSSVSGLCHLQSWAFRDRRGSWCLNGICKKTICTNYATVAWSHLIEKKIYLEKKASLLPFTFCLQIKNTSIYLLKHFHKILKQPLASIFLLLHKKICNSIELQLESFYCIYFHKIKSESALFYKSDCFCLLVWFLSLMFILPVSTLQHWLLQLFFPLDKTFFQFTCLEVGSVRVVLICVMQRCAVFHSWVINFLNILSHLGGTGIYISIPLYIYFIFFSNVLLLPLFISLQLTWAHN